MDQDLELETSEDECSGCKFYRPYRGGGTCHRSPPASPAPKSLLWALAEISWFIAGQEKSLNSHQFDPEAQAADDNDRSLFPQVHEDDWCGEFVRKVRNDQA